MNTVLLYNRLINDRRLSASDKSLLLDTGYLDGLSGHQFDVTKVKEAVCCYFPQGRICVVEIQAFNSPPPDTRIKLEGKGDALPFTGMSISVEIWTEEVNPGKFELRLTIAAYGANDNVWTIATGFPFYRDSLLGEIRLALSGDLKFPLLTLASHEVPAQGILSGLSCCGLLEADSLQGANLRLFLGDEAKSKYIAVFGTIAAFPPEDPKQETIHPYVSLYGGLPARPGGWKLGNMFSIEDIRYALKGSPDYSTATRQWESSCALAWVADLVITPPSITKGKEHSIYRIPIGVDVYQKNGAIRFWSDLREGLSLAWDILAGFIPGTSLRIPTSDFQLKDLVKLTEFELLADRKQNGELYLVWVSLSVETNEKKNRWVLIDRLLALNAIDFEILVRHPASNPAVNFSLSGLVGIGKEGVLRLSADFDHSSNGNDYSFSGQLINNTKLNIKEILTHFLGRSQHPELPEMEVHDFSFSAQPQSKVYEGEILLHGEWGIPGFSGFSIHDVFFKLRHAGEGDTSFQAIGAFELGGARLFVSADYVSNGQGWTFAGGAYEQGKIPIGEWLKDILKMFGLQSTIQPPAPIQELELSDLGVRFNTATKDFSFHGTAEFPIDGKKGSDSSAKLRIQADLTQKPNQTSHALSFSGSLHLFEREFVVGYGSHDNTSLLVAAYDSPNGDTIDVKKFVGQISTDIAKVIPPGLTISLKHAQLAFGKTGDASKFLFGIELGAGIQLSQLPLVGSVFDRSQTLSMVFQLLAASADFEAGEVQEINQLTASGVTKLPEGKIDTSQRKVQIKAVVHLGGISQQLDLPLETDVERSVSVTSTKIVSTAQADNGLVKWFNIQKAFGPFHFQRLGIGLMGQNIDFLLDASLQTAGLTITLEGLAAECALAELSKGNFHPTFHLNGLGVDFKRGDLEIGGALLRAGEDQYDGALTLHYKTLGIQALGSYRAFDGHPSLFVYALINYPIGGPAFFFVEGLALGFGYNRTLTIPALDQVSEFPLVKQAMSPPGVPSEPMQMVAELRQYITPAVGEYFLTAGVRFSSFKNIEGFVLLTVLFGQHFEIDVLGKATLSTPPKLAETGQPPLISASLALLARFLPEEGVLMVMAKLMPDAHVFSPDCHITGGFAFYCWFDKEHKGDFVLTLGGYHKSFDVPAHYPRVPRLGLNWQVNQNLTIKADAYFALTPSALMAGGHLEATWQSGNLRAWFNAAVDFLIAWKPYHYEGEASVSIGASYSFQFFGWHTISVELAADLKIWGPPFSGVAHLHWYIISFDVAFGDQRKQPLKAPEWDEFQASFLPKTSDICSVAAKAGKVAQHGSQAKDKANANQRAHLGVINPRQLSIAVNSAIPITKPSGALLTRPAHPSENIIEPKLGIAPMNKKHGEWESSHEITIHHNGKDVSDQFLASPMRQSVPAALWGEDMNPKSGNRQLIENAICGYEIQLANPISSTLPNPINTTGENLHSLTLTSQLGGSPTEFVPALDQGDVRAKIKDKLLQPGTRSQRQAFLKGLLTETEIDWSGVTVESWRGTPMIVTEGMELALD
ncbi:MAG TPA: DUF6603 domain-containing protein [Blastocatellia bacterium]|nr:DUF6603 domain-containing protein [Blastocatellia bacterium]